jgi:hypothetical protein
MNQSPNADGLIMGMNPQGDLCAPDALFVVVVIIRLFGEAKCYSQCHKSDEHNGYAHKQEAATTIAIDWKGRERERK